MSNSQLEPDEVDALRRLIDRQAIVECVLRYPRGLDRRDEALLRSAYHPDAIEDHGAFVGGLDGLVEYLLAVHEPFAGYQRHVTTTTVDIDGDEAHSESYFVSIIRAADADQLMLSSGRYLDRLERRDREWRIAERVVVLEWHGALAGGAIPSPAESAPRLNRDDPSYRRPLHVTREHRSPRGDVPE